MSELHLEIEKLSGSEAKSLLLNILYRIEFLKKEEDSQSNIVQELLSLAEEVQQELHNEREFDSEKTAVHLICGESPAGSLRIGLSNENQIIGFPDFFAIGPLWKIHTDEGRKKRFEWLLDHINYEVDYIEEEYNSRIIKTLDQINTIPSSIPIILWTATNCDEQIALRYFLYLLREKKNDIYILNITKAFDQSKFDIRHSGEVASHQFKELYSTKSKMLITKEERVELENEWLLLSEKPEKLWIFENGTIQSVQEDYFDSSIIDLVQEIHNETGTIDFILTARVIGEMLSRCPHPIDHGFLEYRIRNLVIEGVFEIKGIPKSMRHYSVKLSLSK